MRLLTLGLIMVKERIGGTYGRRAVRRFLEFDGTDFRWDGSLLNMTLLGGQRYGVVLAGATPYVRIAADIHFSNNMFISEDISGGLGKAVRRSIAYGYRAYEGVEAPKASNVVEFTETAFSVVAISTELVSARSASRSGGDINKDEGRVFIPNAWPLLLL
ncbi:MAG: hypothetical protein RXR06_11300 [Thermoproteus sp.]